MKNSILKTEEDFEQALDRLYEMFDAPIGTLESDEADVLALLVDEYENKHDPIEQKT